MFLTRTSCGKTTHANGYGGAWPGRADSVSVLALTTGRRPTGMRAHGPGRACGQRKEERRVGIRI